MNKKRHFLEAPEVKDYLVKGERFTKWSEVSKHFKKICAAQTLRFYFLLPDKQQRKSYSINKSNLASTHHHRAAPFHMFTFNPCPKCV